MEEELLINVNGFETRVALLHNHALAEVHLQRAGAYSLTGNVYKARVERILPGMQAAFVDVGLSRPGFLHARDIDAPRIIPGESTPGERDIRELVHEGQSLLVQVSKDPISGKGARLTTNLALASRYLVLMPRNDHIGISQRIEGDDERERLRAMTQAAREARPAAAGYGFIVRTAADGAQSGPVAGDLDVLLRIWSLVEERQQHVEAPALVYEELPVHTRVIRDLASANLSAVRIDDARTYSRVKRFVEEFLPEYADLVIHDEGDVGLFDRFGVEEELTRALKRNVPLKSGGYLVIEQTEAMTTVDVNTGGFVGSKNLEETVFRTNMEAAAVIPRQLRLRNLGGIIVIDFIDMEEEDHQRQVMRVLERAGEADTARVRIAGFSQLGLVELSRKRTRESLVQQMCEPCGSCDGRGLVKTAETVCFEIFRAIQRDAPQRSENGQSSSEYLVRASQGVVDRLLDEDSHNVACLAEEVGRPIRFQVEPSYGPEHFDVVLVQGVQR